MRQKQSLPIDKVYVPAKRKRTLDDTKVEEIATSMLEDGQTTPIQVRDDGKRYVLIEGLHRLEAMRALGEDRIDGYLVQARVR